VGIGFVESSKDNLENGSILIIMTLIMVIAAMYLTTALFDVRGTIDQERIYKTKKQMTYLQIAVNDFRINNPTSSLTTFDDLVTRPAGLSSCFLSYVSTFTTMQYPQGWCGPYLDTSLFLGSATAYKEDAWGNNFSLTGALVSSAYVYTIKSSGENASVTVPEDDISVSF
jgi:hypothetical protein